MWGKARIFGGTGACLLLGLLAACTETNKAVDGAMAIGAAHVDSAASSRTRAPSKAGFARLPDRGELLAYTDAAGVRRRGAYTWYPVSLSEDHALRAIASGEMHVASPDGGMIALKYERHIEHPDGNWTWVGRTADGQDAVLTFGESAVFGSIPDRARLPLRLTMQGGRSYLVQIDGSQIANLNIEAVRPTRPDTLKPPLMPRMRVGTPFTAAAAQTALVDSAAAATTTVDVVIGYTNGFASALGGQSAAVTRLNNMVDITNQAYANSQVNARVRLVHAMQVNYVDATDNGVALEDLTGYRDGNAIPVPAALQPLRTARETYGADLVSLVRDFRTPENEGCGIAWILGYGQQSLDQTWSDFGYSVVSDGSDYDETDEGNYYCREETLAHELGHNMGSAHDRETAKGDDGVLDSDDYGRYPYSFGYKTSIDNFFTVMAYGDSGQTPYRVFSNPRITSCGGKACGVTGEADNASSLSQTIPIIATFRPTVVTDTAGSLPRAAVAGNFNGDGKYDIFWRNGATGANVIWRSASSGTPTAVSQVSDTSWKVVATGDFNADGRSDVAWRHAASGKGAIWLSANAGTQKPITTVTNLAWQIVGAGDFNRDGRADLVWRNSSDGKNAIWLSGDSRTQRVIAAVTDTRWQIAGIRDFNGDGLADILWRHSSTGRNTIWRSGDSAAQTVVASVSDLGWQVAGVGDFNGDGKGDIFWHHGDSGRNTIWLSGNSGTQRTVTTTNRSWYVASIGDFNGDGRSDVLWRDAVTGYDVIWRSAYASAVQAVTSMAEASWLVVG